MIAREGYPLMIKTMKIDNYKFFSILLSFIFLVSGTLLGQVANLDFERLDKGIEEGTKVPVGWYPDSPMGFSSTKQSQSGKRALLIHGWYNHVPTLIWNGPVSADPDRSANPLTDATEIHQRISSVKGYYKFTKVVKGSLGEGEVLMLVKTADGMETIGSGKFEFSATDQYQPFEIEIDYKDPKVQPTHISISFFTGKIPIKDAPEPYYNYLFIDSLELLTVDAPEPSYGK